jgi:sarcosine oxidase subunit gamma
MLECAPGSFGAPVSPEAGAVRRLPAASRLSLRIKDSRVGTPCPVARLSLDQPINRVSATDGRFAARLGPDEWLIIAAPSEADDLRSSITEALADRFHALVDVSRASVAFAVEGRAAEDILNAGCPLDLDARHFPAGSVTRTVLGKCEIILFRLSDLVFRVECGRSFGDYVHAFLLEAAALNAQ